MRKMVGLTERVERSRGKGPNHSVEKRRKEKTARFEERREAKTVDADRAAVRERVDGPFVVVVVVKFREEEELAFFVVVEVVGTER